MKNLIMGIKNFWKWKKIIYFDRDYDYNYTYDILQFKMENQSKYFKTSDICIDDKRNAELCKLCSKLIEKLKNDTYECEYQDCYNWGMGIDDKPDYLFWIWDVEDEQKLEKYFYDNRNIYNKIKSEKNYGDLNYDDNKVMCLLIGRIKQEKAQKLLYKILLEKSEGFWN